MHVFFNRLHPKLSGGLFLLALFLLSFFLGGVGCRLESRTNKEASVLSPLFESEVIHAFLWKNEAD